MIENNSSVVVSKRVHVVMCVGIRGVCVRVCVCGEVVSMCVCM